MQNPQLRTGTLLRVAHTLCPWRTSESRETVSGGNALSEKKERTEYTDLDVHICGFSFEVPIEKLRCRLTEKAPPIFKSDPA